MCALGVLAALVACGPTTPLAGPSGESTGEGTSDGDSGSTTVARERPTDGGDESTGETPSNFLEEPDGGGAGFECDVWTQNCPAGRKCTYWANDGSGAWNATKCEEIAPDPDDVGEPCTVEGSGTSGVDTCGIGAMCWDVDPSTNEGTCAELCTGSESFPTCSDPGKRCTGRGPFLCLPTCCPLEQDCLEGQGCYPIEDVFECAPDAGGDMGGFGEPCEYINVCDPGLMCMGASSMPDCVDSSGCCTAFCEVGSTSCGLLHPALACIPWFEEGHAIPGLERAGTCALP